MLFTQPYHQHQAMKEEVVLIIPDATLVGLNRGKFTVNQKLEPHVDFPLEVGDFFNQRRKSTKEYSNLTGRSV